MYYRTRDLPRRVSEELKLAVKAAGFGIAAGFQAFLAAGELEHRLAVGQRRAAEFFGQATQDIGVQVAENEYDRLRIAAERGGLEVARAGRLLLLCDAWTGDEAALPLARRPVSKIFLRITKQIPAGQAADETAA